MSEYYSMKMHMGSGGKVPHILGLDKLVIFLPLYPRGGGQHSWRGGWKGGL